MKILCDLGGKHSNILAFQRVYEDVENVHIITDLCEGELLENLFTSQSLSQHNIATVMCTLVKALKFLHDHGETLHVTVCQLRLFLSPSVTIVVPLCRHHASGHQASQHTDQGWPGEAG